MPSASPFSALRLPALMGIVNVTPDSFSDTGQFHQADRAIAHARELAGQGAHILDLGAEASSFFRPGVQPVPPAEQLRRLLPVLRGLRELPPHVVISVDTRSAEVAATALAEGARIINDISAGTHDAEMLATVARHRAAIILMHISPGYPATLAQDDPDILATVLGFFEERIAAALAVGIPETHLALDPGLGFGKTMADNWRLALNCHRLFARPTGRHYRYPIVLGASRKRFLETPPPGDVVKYPELESLIEAHRFSEDAGKNPETRDAITAALTLITAQQGVAMHRVHQVGLAAAALKNMERHRAQ